jgi:acyl-CoA reductase-like NAD-dependent aldehyde dehydrogenase
MAPKTKPRTMAEIVKSARHEALMDAADAWEALTPQERHLFVRRYSASIAASSLPSAWMRIRAVDELR